MSVYIESKSDKRIRQTASVTVFILALSAGILSYNSLRELAIQSGIPPMLAFLFPITLDGLILAGSLLILYFAVRGKRSGYGLFLTGLGVIASIAGNVVISPDNLTYQILHATSPIVLFLALESLMILLRERSKNAEKVAADHEARESEERMRKEKIDSMVAKTEPAVAEPSQQSVSNKTSAKTASKPVESVPAPSKPVERIPATDSSLMTTTEAKEVSTVPEQQQESVPDATNESVGKHREPIVIEESRFSSNGDQPSKREVIKKLLVKDPAMDANDIIDIVGGDRKYVQKLIRTERAKVSA